MNERCKTCNDRGNPFPSGCIDCGRQTPASEPFAKPTRYEAHDTYATGDTQPAQPDVAKAAREVTQEQAPILERLAQPAETRECYCKAQPGYPHMVSKSYADALKTECDAWRVKNETLQWDKVTAEIERLRRELESEQKAHGVTADELIATRQERDALRAEVERLREKR